MGPGRESWRPLVWCWYLGESGLLVGGPHRPTALPGRAEVSGVRAGGRAEGGGNFWDP